MGNIFGTQIYIKHLNYINYYKISITFTHKNTNMTIHYTQLYIYN